MSFRLTRCHRRMLTLSLVVVAGSVFRTERLPGQSLLDRPPNVSGDWVARSGTIQFNFIHRFVRSSAPERKVTNFPTFEVGVGLPRRLTAGFHYATNSTLASRYPNEWEFFVRHAVLLQDDGAPFDLAGQIGYNLAARGTDGEVSLARRMGPLRLITVTRVLSDPFAKGEIRAAAGGGATLRLLRHLALAGDVTTLLDRSSARGEKAAWSAGLHVALPNTPHTLSLQVTNTNTATLQGLSIGGAQRRYGFEFTIPITLARFFGRNGGAAQPAGGAGPQAATPSAAVPAGGKVLEAGMRGMAFVPSRIEVEAGTTVTWKNNDPLAHTVTAADKSFDSGLVNPGASWSYTFTKPGTYDFSCTPHPFMKGTVVVKAAP
jgi:plastocyanin